MKVFPIDEHGCIFGTNNYTRIPRKLKKLQKKKGIFQLKHIQGFDTHHILYDSYNRTTAPF